MPDEDLFTVERVRVKLRPEDLPGRPRARVVCRSCGEGVNDGREIVMGDRVLCRSCASGGYYEAEAGDRTSSQKSEARSQKVRSQKSEE
jgi:formylmethanofuran dehydrogenase subunit E